MKTSNFGVALAFVAGATAFSASMHTDGKRLFSYGTCIAERVDKRTYLYNATRYTTTTCKHQADALHAMRGKTIRYKYNIKIGAEQLWQSI